MIRDEPHRLRKPPLSGSVSKRIPPPPQRRPRAFSEPR
jgi:hypothetical protein